MTAVPSLEDIRAAAARIAPYAHRTPVVTSATFDALTRANVFFKCENLQRAGAFKFRGACNAVFSLTEAEAKRGVTTHSSGNHAQALALAARMRGIPARIVMPENAPAVKKAAVAAYRGQITYCPPNLKAREEAAQRIIDTTGAVLIHPYDDYRIIAGQATAALELIAESGTLDLVIAPVGGGGLLAGTALATHSLAPHASVIGAEPKGADDAYRSMQQGEILPSVEPKTIADGLLTSLGTRNFPILQEHLREIVTVTDEAIIHAMRFVWERMKLVIEPSAAVPVAALLEGNVLKPGQRAGVILSGGNVDLDRLPWMRAG